MPISKKMARAGIGFLIVFLIFFAVFSLLTPWIQNWGATSSEIAATYPGDNILVAPLVNWSHSETIHARPDQVWPWLIQIGDSRGGFYSFTFIENLVSPGSHYKNADRVHPEWQEPQSGQGIILDMVRIKSYEPGKWLLAASDSADFGWTWVWTLQPEGLNETRLITRMRIQVPAVSNNPVLTQIINVSGFVMEVGMLNGLKDRAEGRIPSSWSLLAGLLLWLLVLACGLICAWRFINQKRWAGSLMVGILCVLALFLLTFVQPMMWARGFMTALLWTGLWLEVKAG